MANGKSEQLLESMVEVTIVIINLTNNKEIPRPIAEQIIKSISSIGANFSEAQEASSKKDFINKIYIAKKEAQETRYWLKVIERITSIDDKIKGEVSRFIMTLQKIITTSKEKH